MTDPDTPPAPEDEPFEADEPIDPDALRASLAEAPEDVPTRMELADALSEAGNASGAVHQLRLALAALGAAPDAPALDRRQAGAATELAEAVAASRSGDPAAVLDRLRAGHGPLRAATLLDGRQALEAGDPRRARRACELVLALAPDRPDGHLLAAALAATDAPLDRRLGHLAAAAGLSPDDAGLRLQMGLRLRALDRPTAAAAALRSALSLDGTLFEAWRSLAAILRDDGQYTAALPLAQHLTALKEDDPAGHILLGQIQDGLDDPEAAAAAYRRALDLDPDLVVPHRLLAECLTRLGQHEDALEAWQSAALDAPDHGRTLQELGDALARLGRHAEAVPWYRRAVALRPESATANERLANALLRREHWAAALPALAVAQPRRPAMGLPPWEGDTSARVVLRHRTADGLDTLLLGLGVAAHAGLDAICLVPREVLGLTRRALPSAEVYARDAIDDAPALVQEHGATAQARFRDLPWVLRGKRGPCVLPAWLAAPQPPTRRWAVIRTTGSDQPPGVMFEGLAEALGPDTLLVDGDQSPDTLAEALADVGAAITGDGAAAHIVGAMGIPGIVLLPPEPPWWWGDRAGGTVWYPRLSQVRAPRPGAWRETLEPVLTLTAPGAASITARPPLRPRQADPDLSEALDRVAPLLGHTATPLACEALTGGTRNKVFKVTAPAGTRVLRLGKFPPRQRDYYSEEFANMGRAGEAGLAPRLFYGDPLDGTMLIDFIDAPALRYRNMRDREAALTAAGLYKRLHALGGFVGRHNTFRNINRLTRRLSEAKDERFMARRALHGTMDSLQDILAENGVPLASCHNDPLAANFLGSAERMLLVDWQMSAMSDPHWEVAALCAQSDMPDPVRDAYYDAYLERHDHPYRARLLLYEVACAWYWWLRALDDLMDEPESEEFIGDEERWWSRLRRRMDSEWFGRSLEAMRHYRHPG